MMLLSDAVAPPSTVLMYDVVAYLGIGALLFLRAGPARVHVRSLSAILWPGSPDVGEQRKHVEWAVVVSMLTRADRELTTGAISLIEREAVWWEAYNRLGRIADVRRGGANSANPWCGSDSAANLRLSV